MSAASAARHPRLRRISGPVAAGLAVGLLVHGIDPRHVAAGLRDADRRWLLVAGLLSLLSVAAGGLTWGLLARAAGCRLSWSQVVSWSGRAVLAGQLVPGGAGGDAVRVVAGRQSGDMGASLAADLLTRVCGAIGITVWALAAAVLLRDDLGTTVVWVASALALGTVLALSVLLCADSLLVPVRRRTSRVARMAVRRLEPVAAVFAAYRRRPGLVAQAVLLGLAGWGVNLAALVCLGHSVGVAVGWQVFAVCIPLTLLATLMPISVNGIGVREGILVGLLARAGIGGGQAVALSVLVDLQLLPVAVLGAALGLRMPAGMGRSGVPSVPAPVPVPGERIEGAARPAAEVVVA